MTPRELSHVLRLFGGEAVPPPTRSALRTLMNMFPDRKEGAQR